MYLTLKRLRQRTSHKFVLYFFRRFKIVRYFALKAGDLALELSPPVNDGTLLELKIQFQRQKNLALGLIQFGFFYEAEVLINRLLASPLAEVKGELSHNLFAIAMEQLNVGKLDTACQLFRLSVEADRTPESSFYLDLVSTLIRLKEEAEKLAAARISEEGVCERFVFSAVVWGEDYIDNFMSYTVRTLIAPGNLPSLADADSYFSIITTPSGADQIRKAPNFVLLEQYIKVVFFLFPETLTQPFHYSRPSFDFYRLYGALDHTSIHFARALKAHIFFIVVDGLLSNNCISSLRRYLNEGFDICCNASIVSNRETLLPDISERYGEEGVIDIPARELANIGFSHLHNYIKQRLVVAENLDFDKHPRELYFPTEEGLVVHALYQHPLVVSASAICEDIEFDYFVVDANLMGRILDRPEKFSRLKVVTESSDVYVANYAPLKRKFDTTGRALNTNDFTAVHHYSLPIHHYIWQHRQLIRCDTLFRTHVNPQQIADALLAALKKELRKIGKL